MQRFKTEALYRDFHPNLVNIYDVGQQDEYYYIVMGLCSGQTQELIGGSPLPIEKG